MGTEQGLLCRWEIATAQTDLADLVQRQAGGRGNVALQLFRRHARLRFRRGPIAAQALDLRAEEPAHAREAGDPLSPAPSILCLRPFGGPLQLAGHGTGLDGGAAHATGHVGRELATQRHHGRFVGEGQAFGELPARHQGRRLRTHRVRRQIDDAEPSANVEGEGGLSERLFAVAGQVGKERPDGGQPAMPGVFGLALQQSLGAIGPCAGDPDRHALQVGDSQIQRGGHGGLVLLGLDRRGVGTLAIFDGLRKLAAPPRGAGEEPEALGPELTSLVRGGQQLECRLPLVAVQGRAGDCQRRFGRVRGLRSLSHPSSPPAAPSFDLAVADLGSARPVPVWRAGP